MSAIQIVGVVMGGLALLCAVALEIASKFTGGWAIILGVVFVVGVLAALGAPHWVFWLLLTGFIVLLGG